MGGGRQARHTLRGENGAHAAAAGCFCCCAPSFAPHLAARARDSPARFLDFFDVVADGVEELWLVFQDEGTSLNNHLYSAAPSSDGSSVVIRPSPFW